MPHTKLYKGGTRGKDVSRLVTNTEESCAIRRVVWTLADIFTLPDRLLSKGGRGMGVGNPACWVHCCDMSTSGDSLRRSAQNNRSRTKA